MDKNETKVTIKWMIEVAETLGYFGLAGIADKVRHVGGTFTVMNSTIVGWTQHPAFAWAKDPVWGIEVEGTKEEVINFLFAKFQLQN